MGLAASVGVSMREKPPGRAMGRMVVDRSLGEQGNGLWIAVGAFSSPWVGVRELPHPCAAWRRVELGRGD